MFRSNRASKVWHERLLLSVMRQCLEVRDPRMTMISLLMSHLGLCPNLFLRCLTSLLGFAYARLLVHSINISLPYHTKSVNLSLFLPFPPKTIQLASFSTPGLYSTALSSLNLDHSALTPQLSLCIHSWPYMRKGISHITLQCSSLGTKTTSIDFIISFPEINSIWILGAEIRPHICFLPSQLPFCIFWFFSLTRQSLVS